jgi:hypothetical protein
VLAATPPPVPVFVQQAIVRRAPQLAYVPARMAIGYRYAAWRYAQGRVLIRFTNRAGREIVFVVARRTTPCELGKEKTFQMAGNKVYWGHRAEEQEAWRCINGVQLTAATPQTPRQFADVGLGRVAASGHLIHS